MTENRTRVVERNGAWGLFMLIAYIGAAVYFVSRTDGAFWHVVLGLLQGLVWPAYLIYHVLEAVHA